MNIHTTSHPLSTSNSICGNYSLLILILKKNFLWLSNSWVNKGNSHGRDAAGAIASLPSFATSAYLDAPTFAFASLTLKPMPLSILVRSRERSKERLLNSVSFSLWGEIRTWCYAAAFSSLSRYWWWRCNSSCLNECWWFRINEWLWPDLTSSALSLYIPACPAPLIAIAQHSQTFSTCMITYLPTHTLQADT